MSLNRPYDPLRGAFALIHGVHLHLSELPDTQL
jgi:hypothetical protein